MAWNELVYSLLISHVVTHSIPLLSLTQPLYVLPFNLLRNCDKDEAKKGPFLIGPFLISSYIF